MPDRTTAHDEDSHRDSPPPHSDGGKKSVGRRRFLTYVLAAPTLTIGGKWVLDHTNPGTAAAQLPPIPGPTESDYYDLGDALTHASLPTMPLLTLEITGDNRAKFALPRMEVGQGIQTAVAMMIAEELSFPLDRVDVTLMDSNPDLLFNQLTGGSYNARALYQPVSRMAAGARERTKEAAAKKWNVPIDSLSVVNGTVLSQDGLQHTFGQLTQEAAKLSRPLDPAAKPISQHTLLGKFTPRVDAREIVTGRKKYTVDLDVPGAKPAVSVHSRDLMGTLTSFDNEDEIRNMPGVIDVATIRAVPHMGFGHPAATLGDDAKTAIIIVAETYGQAMAAEQAVQATWNPGPVADMSDDDFSRELRAAPHPLVLPDGPQAVTGEFEFRHVAHAPLETMSAVADVRQDSAEIWSGLKIPIPAQQEIAEGVGLPLDAVTVHVVPSGGSFGRRLFHETALEAALASKAMGRPVKLQWSRNQDTQHDRYRPPSIHKIRATHALGSVVNFEHRYTGGYISFSHGLGDALTSIGAHEPTTNYGIALSIHALQLTAPYNLGVITQTLREIDFKMTPHTGSWRSVYTGTARTVEEIMMDEIAAALGKDPVEYRLATAKEDALKKCIRWVAEHGDWGKKMPPGTAQGFAGNSEGRSNVACLVEIDVRGKQPRVTKAVMAYDAGLPLNPAGIEGQMLGGLNDGIATILQAGIHIDNGAVREKSYGDYTYTLQGDSPTNVLLHIFPVGGDDALIGGAGEFSVPVGAGAIANAYARATGTKPRSFPLNF